MVVTTTAEAITTQADPEESGFSQVVAEAHSAAAAVVAALADSEAAALEVVEQEATGKY